MRENKQEMSMQVINEKSFIYKIKSFFKRLFLRRKLSEVSSEENIIKIDESNNKTRNAFIEHIKIETNEKLLALQKRLEEGKITIEELTEEEKDNLIELYDKQIEIKKEKLQNIKDQIIDIRKKLKVS